MSTSESRAVTMMRFGDPLRARIRRQSSTPTGREHDIEQDQIGVDPVNKRSAS